MKACYTISPLEQVLEIPNLFTAQITLNGRIFPSRRKTIEHLENVYSQGAKCNLLIHEDFIYICTRYALFVDHIQRAIIAEIVSLLKYGTRNNHIKGIVMHTDFPIRRALLSSKVLDTEIEKYYKSQVWNHSFIKEHVLANDIAEASICKFVTDLSAQIDFVPSFKILLENTTKVGPSNEGSLEWIVHLFKKYPYLSNICGIVYDTEHHYAITGEWLSVESLQDLSKLTQIVVHLNTIPKEVKPGKGLDRHSETTISECSVNTQAFYEAYAKALDDNSIYWVREVHSDTMFRELKLWQ